MNCTGTSGEIGQEYPQFPDNIIEHLHYQQDSQHLILFPSSRANLLLLHRRHFITTKERTEGLFLQCPRALFAEGN